MIFYTQINYVFVVNKEISTVCKAPCTFNLWIQIFCTYSFEAKLSKLSPIKVAFLPQLLEHPFNKRDVLSSTLNESNPHSKKFSHLVWTLFILDYTCLKFQWKKSHLFLSSINLILLTHGVVTISWSQTLR